MGTDQAPELGPICVYCFQENSIGSSRCARCGAPLPEEQSPIESEPEAAEPEAAEPEAAEPVIGEKVLPHPGRQWRGAAAAAANTAQLGIRNPGRIIGIVVGTGAGIALVIGGLLVLVFVVLAHTLPSFDTPATGTRTGGRSWADQLRSIATCGRINVDERCVIAAGHTVLWGGVTGGRDLTFWIRPLPADALGATVRQWRAEGGKILCDAQTFVQISPTAAVHYANGRAGVVVETDPFIDRSGALAFLSRSGAVC
ncbi:hypothetical protein [Nocardia colli]|uniref:hypothetical protein n=1 Tax=Nocardia colli TaxID=2545717 RepID=UPI0035D597EE